jgi:hypothetical protein
MVDCSTGAPLPDLYTGIVWSKTMGPTVLATTVASVGSSAIRAYAHCSAGGKGGVTVLLINLSPNSTTVTLNMPTLPRFEYVLTPSIDPSSSMTKDTGLLGTGIQLNGEVLKVPAGGGLPAMAPKSVTTGDAVAVPATGIAFVVLPASPADVAVCTQAGV